MQAPVMVLNMNTERESGRTAQLNNIAASKAVSDIIRSTLGPKSMLKMLLDPMGGIVITNDGHCILREVDVSHPAAKSMIELSRSQDEEVGDGTTSVIILTGEMLNNAKQFLERNFHPIQIVKSFHLAMQIALKTCEEQLCRQVDFNDEEELFRIVSGSIGTKFSGRYGEKLVNIAIEAVKKVAKEEHGYVEVDVKRYVKVEKIPGGELEDCRVMDGVMFNKDVTHSAMRRRIENPRIVLLDCPLEYKKSDSDVKVDITDERDWSALLRQEEEYIEQMCAHIVALQPDIVITEKGLSDLAQEYLVRANITAFRRLRKSDNNRVARATGATIASRVDEMTEEDVGKSCGLFEVRKIGDEYFAFFEECRDPKACTILLRGASKDVLNEMERNLHDALQVCSNIRKDSKLLPGGSATEMACAHAIRQVILSHGPGEERKEQFEFDGVVYEESVLSIMEAVAQALESIAKVLIENTGKNTMRTMTLLRAQHSLGNFCTGINGETGELLDMNESTGIWEPYCVKTQTIKTSIESASMLLRIDDIVSGITPSQG
jgi:T-complex protein 1 subunit gamma